MKLQNSQVGRFCKIRLTKKNLQMQ